MSWSFSQAVQPLAIHRSTCGVGLRKTVIRSFVTNRHKQPNNDEVKEQQMAFWRMQLHPGGSKEAMKHAVESLSAGYIGLDFGDRIPDMLTVTQEALPEIHRNYWAFAGEMQVDDRVLLFTHHFPLALVRVAG